MAAHSSHASTHASGSAFSACAYPNEDWTKILDLAERRRIQNRIAQRNYRKKLKRRLAELEHRARSSSTSPGQQHSEPVPTPAKEISQKQPQSVASQSSRSSISRGIMRASPEILPSDDNSLLFDTPTGRHISTYSQPTFTLSSYPPTTIYPQHEQQQHPTYEDVSSYFSTYPVLNEVSSSSLSPTLAAVLPVAYVKQDHSFGDDILSPFSIHYASLAGLEMPPNQAYIGANSHVNSTIFFSPSYSSPHI